MFTYLWSDGNWSSRFNCSSLFVWSCWLFWIFFLKLTDLNSSCKLFLHSSKVLKAFLLMPPTPSFSSLFKTWGLVWYVCLNNSFQCFWKYMWVKKYVKIRVILFKDWKHVFKLAYQTEPKISELACFMIVPVDCSIFLW